MQVRCGKNGADDRNTVSPCPEHLVKVPAVDAAYCDHRERHGLPYLAETLDALARTGILRPGREEGTEADIVRAGRLCRPGLLDAMRGYSYDPAATHELARLFYRQVILSQMNTVSVHGHRDVRMIIDDECGA